MTNNNINSLGKCIMMAADIKAETMQDLMIRVSKQLMTCMTIVLIPSW